MRKKMIGVLLIGLTCLALGCKSTTRVDPEIEAIATHEFNPKDLNLISKTVDEMMTKNALNRPKKPAVYVARIRNRTNEHLNTEAIHENIAYELGKTERVRLVSRSAERDEIMNELEFQQGAMVDPTTAKQIGKQLGADFFFVGVLTNIESRAGGKKGQYFLFFLTLVDVETGEQWKARHRIQKLTKRSLFGW